MNTIARKTSCKPGFGFRGSDLRPSISCVLIVSTSSHFGPPPPQLTLPVHISYFPIDNPTGLGVPWNLNFARPGSHV